MCSCHWHFCIQLNIWHTMVSIRTCPYLQYCPWHRNLCILGPSTGFAMKCQSCVLHPLWSLTVIKWEPRLLINREPGKKPLLIYWNNADSHLRWQHLQFSSLFTGIQGQYQMVLAEILLLIKCCLWEPVECLSGFCSASTSNLNHINLLGSWCDLHIFTSAEPFSSTCYSFEPSVWQH